MRELYSWGDLTVGSPSACLKANDTNEPIITTNIIQIQSPLIQTTVTIGPTTVNIDPITAAAITESITVADDVELSFSGVTVVLCLRKI